MSKRSALKKIGNVRYTCQDFWFHKTVPVLINLDANVENEIEEINGKEPFFCIHCQYKTEVKWSFTGHLKYVYDKMINIYLFDCHPYKNKIWSLLVSIC